MGMRLGIRNLGSNTSGSYSTGNSIVQTSDDGYAVAGNLKEDGYVIKMDKDGNENWKKTFVGSNNDNFYSIVQSGNDYVVAGFKGKDYIWNGPQGDLWVIKLDSNGTEAWNKTIGDGRGTNQEEGSSIIQTTDGNYVVAGHLGYMVRTSVSYSFNNYGWLMKLDSNGNLE